MLMKCVLFFFCTIKVKTWLGLCHADQPGSGGPGCELGASGIFGSREQFGLVTQSCLSLCDPMDCSTPGLPVHHQPLELAQTPVHEVGDATQPSHPLSSPSPPTFSLSCHRVLFQWVVSLHQMVKVTVISNNNACFWVLFTIWEVDTYWLTYFRFTHENAVVQWG